MLFSGEMFSGTPEAVIDAAAVGLYNDTLEAIRHGQYVKGLDDWRDGFYEPMGYHTGGTGAYLHSAIWGTPERRRHIWNYCPEMKMTLPMDFAKFVPGDCNARWKRNVAGDGVDSWELEQRDNGDVD